MSSKFLKDRGPAKYFHGREEIIDTFSSVLEFSREENEGTTFLIQGAPGAGKTALLDVLSRQAKSNGWEIADITIKNLYSPVSMAQSLGEAYVLNSEAALKAGITFIEGGLVESVAGHASSEEILKRLAPENGLILVLDEAQRLHKIPDNSERHTVASDTLEMIHNGKLESPVILLTAGLGTSESAYGSLGISRIDVDCTVQLGRLDKESERAVIQDWLTQAGGAAGDPSRWIDSIAEQAHGWPQHIISYIKPAVKFLISNHGKMTEKGLEFVHEKGNEYRLQYYDKRAHDIDEDYRQALAQAVVDVPLDATTTRPAIISSLKNSGLAQKEADVLFAQALEQGILDKCKRGRYGIPIPSLHRWLMEEYGKEKSHDIPPTPKQLSPKPEPLLPPPKKNDQPSVKKDKREDKRKGRGGFYMER